MDLRRKPNTFRRRTIYYVQRFTNPAVNSWREISADDCQDAQCIEKYDLIRTGSICKKRKNTSWASADGRAATGKSAVSWKGTHSGSGQTRLWVDPQGATQRRCHTSFPVGRILWSVQRGQATSIHVFSVLQAVFRLCRSTQTDDAHQSQTGR